MTTERPKGYLPTLDGWRAISILLVIMRHESVHSFGPLSTRWFSHHGEIGVDVFFAISGILICSRLLSEESQNDSISLKSFYIRRATRILPPVLAFLCVLALLHRFFPLSIAWREWLGSLFFLRNYTKLLHLSPLSPGLFTGHFWSLSVEEHFYLIFPAILVLTRKRSRLPILAVLAILIFLRCGEQIRHREWWEISHHTDVRLNSLLIPAMFAVVGMKEKFKIWLRFWPIALVIVCCLITFFAVSAWQVTAIAFLLSCTVYGSVLNPDSLLGRFLELEPLRYIGKISYSLYLWQQLFFVSHYHLRIYPLGSLQRWPWCFLMTVGCAITSYYVIEVPLIKLGHRVARRVSTGRIQEKKMALAGGL